MNYADNLVHLRYLSLFYSRLSFGNSVLLHYHLYQLYYILHKKMRFYGSRKMQGLTVGSKATGYSTRFYAGRLYPKVQSLPPLYFICDKRYPFPIPFITETRTFLDFFLAITCIC